MYYKLLKSGIDKNIIKLIKNMYDKTSLRLKMNGQVTTGKVLGPGTHVEEPVLANGTL